MLIGSAGLMCQKLADMLAKATWASNTCLAGTSETHFAGPLVHFLALNMVCIIFFIEVNGSRSFMVMQ